MLLSPGHSPRLLSPPSPSLSDCSLEIPRNSSISAKNPGKQSIVLDEDTYISTIEKIIERDFFPDIPKLQDRLDWLEAVRTGDPVQIRDAQLKIIERRCGKISNPEATEGKNPTPGSTFFRTTTPFDMDGTLSVANDEFSCATELNHDSIDVPSTLDQFFRRYTSEDNDSFSKIMEKVNRKRKERYGHLREGEKGEVESIEDVKRARITDGYGTSDQSPSTLKGWNYTAKNLLMYHPSDQGEAPFTKEERAERLKGLTKEINRSNTRFHGKMKYSIPLEDDAISVFYMPLPGATPISDREGDKIKKYDLEDLRKTPNQFYVESSKKSENGYNFVKTPSPRPAVDESPFITWGEIEGTPLRLGPGDTPVGMGGSGDGSSFKIPLPRSRDVKAHSLLREAARKLRERSMMFQKPPLPSPARGRSASPSSRPLSPAAQKFVRNAIAKASLSVDESLRASYRGTSPGLGTPGIGRSLSRFARDGTVDSRSPSVREGSNLP